MNSRFMTTPAPPTRSSPIMPAAVHHLVPEPSSPPTPPPSPKAWWATGRWMIPELNQKVKLLLILQAMVIQELYMEITELVIMEPVWIALLPVNSAPAVILTELMIISKPQIVPLLIHHQLLPFQLG